MGSALKTLIIIALILIVIGLWLIPGPTKNFLTGAASSVKSTAANLF